MCYLRSCHRWVCPPHSPPRVKSRKATTIAYDDDDDDDYDDADDDDEHGDDDVLTNVSSLLEYLKPCLSIYGHKIGNIDGRKQTSTWYEIVRTPVSYNVVGRFHPLQRASVIVFFIVYSSMMDHNKHVRFLSPTCRILYQVLYIATKPIDK